MDSTLPSKGTEGSGEVMEREREGGCCRDRRKARQRWMSSPSASIASATSGSPKPMESSELKTAEYCVCEGRTCSVVLP